MAADQGTQEGPKRPELGAAAVEFALILPILVALLMGILQFGWYFYASNSASSAAREGARRLVVGDCWTNFETFVKAQAPPVITTATYSPSSLTSANVGDAVTVTVKANGALVSFFPWGSSGGEVVRVFKARLEDKTSTGSC